MSTVSIRRLAESDAATSVGWRNNPSIWEFTESAPDHVISLDEELNWIRKVIARGDERRFAIMLGDEHVGNIYLTGINHGESAEYHIFIGERSAQGKGVARQASLLLLEFARTQLGLKAIELSVRRDHARARSLYRSLGFRDSQTQSSSNDERLVTMRLSLDALTL